MVVMVVGRSWVFATITTTTTTTTTAAADVFTHTVKLIIPWQACDLHCAGIGDRRGIREHTPPPPVHV